MLLALLFAGSAFAQVPSTLNYQGRVAVSGVNFTGTGQFKFALVNGAGSQTFWSNDGTSNAGSQPSAAVSIAVSGGLYSVQLGDTALANMTAVPASAFGTADVRLRVWFNDGVNGFQLMTPDQKIAAVGYAMVAATVPDGSITAAKLAPGVGGGGGSIPDGSITAAKLAAGAAAGNLAAGGLSAVASGGVIGSTEANSSALAAQGFVRDPASIQSDGQWIPMPSGDTVAGHAAVWTGTELLIWGGVEPAVNAGMPSYAAINRGIRYNPATGVWLPISAVGAPQGRFGHSAVWTGTEMIVWGGQTGNLGGAPSSVLTTGGRYNPTTNTWTGIAPNVDASGPPPGIPDGRRDHLAFFTGTEMLIWGGSSTPGEFASTGGGGGGSPLSGKRYNVAANTWSSMAESNPELTSPTNYSGVWTGTEMIIWAGGGPPGTPPMAGRYSPGANQWQALPSIPGDPQMAGEGFSTLWTGTEMIIWGGVVGGGGGNLNTGVRFNPAGNSGLGSWATVSTTGAPTARARHYAVRSGSEMIIWGGDFSSPVPPPANVLLNDGGRYNPGTDTWQALSTTDAPAARSKATVTVAGDKLVVWAGVHKSPSSSGVSQAKFLKHGAIYQLGSNVWTGLYNGSPAPRFGHTAIWTGTDLIVWGGTTSSMTPMEYDPLFNDGARFNATTGLWTPLPTLNAPAARFHHAAVWTGTEMIIWGGQRFDTNAGMTMTVTLNSGARYDPLTNTWTSTTLSFPPTARSKHTAVWAGSPVNRMIVWGGSSDGASMGVNTGGSYDPATNSWGSPTSSTNAPMAAYGHQAHWTGSEMIVVGGAMTNGSRYYPLSNSWAAMAIAPAGMTVNTSFSSVWAGTEMLAFAPNTSTPSLLASYSPIGDFWQTLSSTSAPAGGGVSPPTAVWAGTEMIIWGLTGTAPPPTASTTGGSYSSLTGSWSSLESLGAPAMGYGSGVWTSTEMLLWGGSSASGGMMGTVSDKGHRYRLPQSYYLYRKP